MKNGVQNRPNICNVNILVDAVASDEVVGRLNVLVCDILLSQMMITAGMKLPLRQPL